MKDETIRIGDDIVITICAVHGARVRVGVIAARDVAVHRGEVYDAIKRKNGEVGPGKEMQ